MNRATERLADLGFPPPEPDTRSCVEDRNRRGCSRREAKGVQFGSSPQLQMLLERKSKTMVYNIAEHETNPSGFWHVQKP